MRQLAVGILAVAATTVLCRGTATAAEVSDTVSATVTLDASGSLTLHQFDPAHGQLTGVHLTITAATRVQLCVENTADTAAEVGGMASGSVTAAFSGGAASTAAAAELTVAPAPVTATDATADCAAGFDAGTGRFPAPVTAGDVQFGSETRQATATTTLTSPADLARFTGTGTIAVEYSGTSQTTLSHAPPSWQTFSVAQADLEATVTYAYAMPSGELPGTGGGNPTRLATAAALVLASGAAAVIVARYRRSDARTGEVRS